jgi:CubicO group peptidase (beta-lactamase class C family)
MLNDFVPPTVSRRTSLLLGLGCRWLAAAPMAAAWQPLASRIDQAIAGKLLPSIQIAVMKDGKFIHSGAHGTADFEAGTAAATTSIYRIASCSKQFTAAGILALAEEGRLSIDDKLAKFIPDFPQADTITLRQILNHNAGLGNHTRTKPPEAFLQISRAYRTDAEMLALAKAMDPVYISKPGTGHSYSNTGFLLLGLIIARLTNAPYGEYLRTRIFDKAGLSRTRVDDERDIVVGRVSGYTQGKNTPTGFANASFISMTFPGGAGSMRSTAEELCTWHAALLSGKVLRQASVDQMLTPGRLSNGELPRNSQGRPIQYGFGVDLTDVDGRRAVSHRGTIQGFRSHICTLIQERISVAYLINTDPLSGGKELDSFGPELEAQAFKIARSFPG